MKIFTAGTRTYKIPLPKPYSLKCELPLIIIEDWDGFVDIECPLFDEYGYGKNFNEALNDLGSSIVDFWKSLRRLRKRKRNLGESLRRVFEALGNYIVIQGYNENP